MLNAIWKGWMEGHRQCSWLVGRCEWRGIDSAHGLLESVIGGAR